MLIAEALPYLDCILVCGVCYYCRAAKKGCLVAQEFLWDTTCGRKTHGKWPKGGELSFILSMKSVKCLWGGQSRAMRDKAVAMHLLVTPCKQRTMPVWNPRAVSGHNFHPTGIVAVAGLGGPDYAAIYRWLWTSGHWYESNPVQTHSIPEFKSDHPQLSVHMPLLPHIKHKSVKSFSTGQQWPRLTVPSDWPHQFASINPCIELVAHASSIWF